MKFRVVILLLLLAVWVVSAQPEQNHFEVYNLGFSDPVSAVDMVRVIVGPAGSVSLDEVNRRLLVVTTKEKHAQVADMMRKLNVPPKNVRIDVRFLGSSSQQNIGAEIRTSGEIVREEGITRTKIKVKPRIENTTLTASSDVIQTLLVANGREGLLRVGEATITYHNYSFCRYSSAVEYLPRARGRLKAVLGSYFGGSYFNLRYS